MHRSEPTHHQTDGSDKGLKCSVQTDGFSPSPPPEERAGVRRRNFQMLAQPQPLFSPALQSSSSRSNTVPSTNSPPSKSLDTSPEKPPHHPSRHAPAQDPQSDPPRASRSLHAPPQQPCSRHPARTAKSALTS